ncbi:MAG: hypothetical protein Q9210_001323 [Variospora velana]
MGPSYKALVDKLIDSSDRAWVDVSTNSNELNNVAQRDPSALAVASEHIAFETVGKDFDDCHSDTELDDSDNESIPELVDALYIDNDIEALNATVMVPQL